MISDCSETNKSIKQLFNIIKEMYSVVSAICDQRKVETTMPPSRNHGQKIRL